MTSQDDNPVPEDWNRYRGYLRVLAQGVGQGLQSKVDPSDIVQQTLLDAYRALASYRGSTEAEKMAWMRRILQRNVWHAVRHFSRDKRDVNREQAIAAALQGSSIRIEKLLEGQGPSPSDEIIRQEKLLAICDAVQQLPADQQRAVELHHLQGLPVSAVASEMDRSVTAVAGLLKRGLKALRSAVPKEHA